MRKTSLCAVFLTASVASAHVELTSPVPRTNQGNEGKGGISSAAAATDPTGPPCGAPKPASAQYTYAPGAQITVKILETVDHVSVYYLEWSDANDSNFTAFMGNSTTSIVADKAQAGGTQNTYSVQVTLPNKTVDNGTMRLV